MVRNSPIQVTVEKDGISTTFPTNHLTLAPSPIPVHELAEYAKDENKDGLPTEEMQKNVHTTHAQRPNLVYATLVQNAMPQNVNRKKGQWDKM